jgi:hypothetical protein
MSHRGFRVFLDRFSGTSGRLFPQEIAEELAERDVVLVLETPGILQSRWTFWEIAFARTYRLGLLALHWQNAPQLRGIVDRHQVAPRKNGRLTAAELPVVAGFIERCHTLAALTRRAFYEALVEAAACSKQGAVRPAGEGVVELVNKNKLSKGFVMPSGRPGCLGDVHRLVSASGGSGGLPCLLAGQHEHHRPSAQDDLNWLAGTAGIRLSGRADIYKHVKALL